MRCVRWMGASCFRPGVHAGLAAYRPHIEPRSRGFSLLLAPDHSEKPGEPGFVVGMTGLHHPP
jgi:hypothetical protein